jgi:patatin-like phospholipase/acyl hydrolase
MSSTLEGDHPLGISGSVAAAAPTCKCLNERDRHLFCPGPKSILALDGGGVRGAITVAFLEQIEKVLTERLGEPVHLANWFDLVGGTSTGAVIAGALAVGYTTEDIRKFYLELAPKVFRRSLWRLLTLRPKFDAEALRKEIERVVGNRKLSSSDLNTGFCLISKRLDTGSPWILANNPRAPYWKTKSGKDGYIGNKHYPLANLVRASTAAPFYFEPEWMEIVRGEKPGLFVDGGVTPHNNASVMLFLMTILDAFNIRWKATPDDLTIVSVGTGSYRGRLVPEELGMGWTLRMTYHALMSLMNDIQTLALMH